MAFRTEDILEEFAEVAGLGREGFYHRDGFGYFRRNPREVDSQEVRRAKRSLVNRANYLKIKSNPVLYKQRLEKSRKAPSRAKIAAKYYQKVSADAEMYARHLSRSRAAGRQYLAKIKADPARHAMYLEKRRILDRKRREKQKSGATTKSTEPR